MKRLENIRSEEVGKREFLDEANQRGGIRKNDPNFRISLERGEAILRTPRDNGNVVYLIFKN